MKSSEAKKLIQEVLIEHLNEVKQPVSPKDRELYQKGVALGISDKLKSIPPRNLTPDKIPQAFIDGYNTSRKESWWNKFNARMTDYLGRIGSSRLR